MLFEASYDLIAGMDDLISCNIAQVFFMVNVSHGQCQ